MLLTPPIETSAGCSAIDNAASKVSEIDPLTPVHAPALNTAPGSAQSKSSVHPDDEAPGLCTQAANALAIVFRFRCGAIPAPEGVVLSATPPVTLTRLRAVLRRQKLR